MVYATVSALCYLIIAEFEGSSLVDYERRNGVVRFSLGQFQRMPDYMRYPLFILVLCFNLDASWKTGVFFHRQEEAVRRIHFLSWKYSRFGFKRDFARLVESLSVFAWLSRSSDQSRQNG